MDLLIFVSFLTILWMTDGWGIKQKTPHNNTLSRKPLKFSELVFDLILDLRDVLI